MKSCLILLVRKTAEAHICVFPENVWIKRLKIIGLERSLKTAVPDEVYERLKKELEDIENNRVLSLIGLATKAGKTVSGEFSTEKSVKTGKGLLVIVAEDASENTKKKIRNMCSFL